MQSHIQNSDAISGALWYYSGGNLDPAQIAQDFKSTGGPSLKSVNFSSENFEHRGQYDYRSNSILLENSLLSKVEGILSSGSENAKSIALIEFMEVFVNEYTHYGDAIDGMDLIQTGGGLINDMSPSGTEPSRPNRFEEGNEAASFLYPLPTPVQNFGLFKLGVIKSSNGETLGKAPKGKDESKLPKPDQA